MNNLEIISRVADAYTSSKIRSYNGLPVPPRATCRGYCLIVYEIISNSGKISDLSISDIYHKLESKYLKKFRRKLSNDYSMKSIIDYIGIVIYFLSKRDFRDLNISATRSKVRDVDNIFKKYSFDFEEMCYEDKEDLLSVINPIVDYKPCIPCLDYNIKLGIALSSKATDFEDAIRTCLYFGFSEPSVVFVSSYIMLVKE